MCEREREKERDVCHGKENREERARSRIQSGSKFVCKAQPKAKGTLT